MAPRIASQSGVESGLMTSSCVYFLIGWSPTNGFWSISLLPGGLWEVSLFEYPPMCPCVFSKDTFIGCEPCKVLFHPNLRAASLNALEGSIETPDSIENLFLQR